MVVPGRVGLGQHAHLAVGLVTSREVCHALQVCLQIALAIAQLLKDNAMTFRDALGQSGPGAHATTLVALGCRLGSCIARTALPQIAHTSRSHWTVRFAMDETMVVLGMWAAGVAAVPNLAAALAVAPGPSLALHLVG